MGVNEAGYEGGNDWFTSVSDLPWLQDVDANGDTHSDVWTEWGVNYRDVVILDKENVPLGSFNLSTYGLHLVENYVALGSILIEAAMSPSADFDRDGDVDGDDFLIWQVNFGTQTGATSYSGDTDGDGDVDGNDFLVWQSAFGGGSGLSGSSLPVPEPGAAVLLFTTLVWLAAQQSRRVMRR